MNGFSKNRYYYRIQELMAQGLVKRKLGIFSLTSFGEIIYDCKLRIDAAVNEYYKLKAIDSTTESKEIGANEGKELINKIISDIIIKSILLGKCPPPGRSI
jgi:hypothetical protein